MPPDAADLAANLAARLKQLRTQRRMTQSELGRRLKVSSPWISAWENAHAVPTPERLSGYAEVFGDGDDARQALERELLALSAGTRSPAPGPAAAPGGLWRFADGNTVTIVCGVLSRELREAMPYTSRDDPDYVRLYRFADPDSLLVAYGHVMAANPHCEVTPKTAPEMTEEDYKTHLIVLGGVDFNEATRKLLRKLRLPVQQGSFYADRDAAFELVDGARVVQRFAAKLDPPEQPHGKPTLVEDVGHLVHGPNPYNRGTTFTMCNGMYGRGVYGAVRALTDKEFNVRNTAYVRDRFPPTSTFSLLFAVEPYEDTVHTPDWTAPGTVLHAWSDNA